MAENAAAAGLESHRIKSFKNKGRDAEVRAGPRPGPASASAGGRHRRGEEGPGRAALAAGGGGGGSARGGFFSAVMRRAGAEAAAGEGLAGPGRPRAPSPSPPGSAGPGSARGVRHLLLPPRLAPARPGPPARPAAGPGLGWPSDNGAAAFVPPPAAVAALPPGLGAALPAGPCCCRGPLPPSAEPGHSVPCCPVLFPALRRIHPFFISNFYILFSNAGRRISNGLLGVSS